jgi:hypothetical protein
MPSCGCPLTEDEVPVGARGSSSSPFLPTSAGVSATLLWPARRERALWARPGATSIAGNRVDTRCAPRIAFDQSRTAPKYLPTMVRRTAAIRRRVRGLVDRRTGGRQISNLYRRCHHVGFHCSCGCSICESRVRDRRLRRQTRSVFRPESILDTGCSVPRPGGYRTRSRKAGSVRLADQGDVPRCIDD